MDVSPIATTATALAERQVHSQVTLNVLKKAIDLESAGALQLIQAVPNPPAPAGGGGSGAGIDTWA